MGEAVKTMGMIYASAVIVFLFVDGVQVPCQQCHTCLLAYLSRSLCGLGGVARAWAEFQAGLVEQFDVFDVWQCRP